MSLQKNRFRLEEAMIILRGLMTDLDGCFEKIEVAGSVRRGARAVGDVELVGVPIMREEGLFGQAKVPIVNEVLDGLVRSNQLAVIKNGPKYKQFLLPKIKRVRVAFDLWLVDRLGWGNQLAIRTGPAEFSKAIVTQRSKMGLLDDNYRVRDGFVWKCGDRGQWQMVPMESEAAFFELIEGGYRAPKDRMW